MSNRRGEGERDLMVDVVFSSIVVASCPPIQDAPQLCLLFGQTLLLVLKLENFFREVDQ